MGTAPSEEGPTLTGHQRGTPGGQGRWESARVGPARTWEGGLCAGWGSRGSAVSESKRPVARGSQKSSAIQKGPQHQDS